MGLQASNHDSESSSTFLAYLATLSPKGGERLPSIPELAKELGISTGKLREQIEVARQMGLLEVKPKTGIRFLGYDFSPTVSASLRFAIALDRDYFDAFGELRKNIEASFWFEAVEKLDQEDIRYLESLVERAWQKLNGSPIEIPHTEHREFHLAIFSRLENIFVRGMLEAYWVGYEAAGLNVYEDYSYLIEVWTFHRSMVEAIAAGELEAGHQALLDHTKLLSERPSLASTGAIQESGLENIANSE